MNLIVIATKHKVMYGWCHSNFHHLKIVKAISDHFRYNFLGDEVGKKNYITLPELMKEIEKNSNPYEKVYFEELKDLRQISKEDREFSGYILICLEDLGHNDLFLNLSTTENDRELWQEFSEKYKEVVKKLRK
jgi:hypothetical protein